MADFFAADTSVPEAAEQGQPNDQDKQPEKDKKRKRIPPFQETHLVSSKGFLRICKHFPKVLGPVKKGKEHEWLKNLIYQYKQWGYDLYPKLAFEDLHERIQKLSSKARIRGELDDMRASERDRQIEIKYGEGAGERFKANQARGWSWQDEGVEGEGNGDGQAMAPSHAGASGGRGAKRRRNRYGEVDDESAEPQTHEQHVVEPVSGGSGGLSAEVLARIEANRQKALATLAAKRAQAPAPAAAAGQHDHEDNTDAMLHAEPQSRDMTDMLEDMLDDEEALASMMAEEETATQQQIPKSVLESASASESAPPGSIPSAAEGDASYEAPAPAVQHQFVQEAPGSAPGAEAKLADTPCDELASCDLKTAAAGLAVAADDEAPIPAAAPEVAPEAAPEAAPADKEGENKGSADDFSETELIDFGEDEEETEIE